MLKPGRNRCCNWRRGRGIQNGCQFRALQQADVQGRRKTAVDILRVDVRLAFRLQLPEQSLFAVKNQSAAGAGAHARFATGLQVAFEAELHMDDDGVVGYPGYSIGRMTMSSADDQRPPGP